MQVSPSLIDWSNPINRESPLTRGLVGWWMAVPGQMGYGTNQWRDLLGRHHGTLTNMDPATDWVADSPVGHWGSLDFTPLNSVYLGSVISENIATSITAHFFLRVTTSNNNSFGFHPANAGNKNNLYPYNDNRIYLSAFGPNTRLQIDTSSFDFSQWHTLTITNDGSTYRVYQNGNEIGNTSAGTIRNELTDPDYATIGSGEGMEGNISDLLLFDRALPPAQVAALDDESRRGYPSMLRWQPTTRYFLPSGGGATVAGRGIFSSNIFGGAVLT